MKHKFKIFLIIGNLVSINANSLDLNKNLFRYSCNLIDGVYKECDFSNINIFPFSKIQSEEYIYKIDYSFNDCNFNELNLQFNTNKDFFLINSGNKSISLEGYTLKIKDTYIWDTQTNEYDNKCSFVINNIEAKFSHNTVEKLNSYYKIMEENKKFINEIDRIYPLIEALALNIMVIDRNKFEGEFSDLLNLLASEKLKYNASDIMYFLISDIEEQLSVVMASSPSLSKENNYKQLKNKLLPLIFDLSKILNTQDIKNNNVIIKHKINSILKAAESIPNFNQTELTGIRNQLNKL